MIVREKKRSLHLMRREVLDIGTTHRLTKQQIHSFEGRTGPKVAQQLDCAGRRCAGEARRSEYVNQHLSSNVGIAVPALNNKARYP